MKRQLIDSTAISQWFIGRRRDAQELLPHLVRKLIASTVRPGAIVKLHIPVGDDVARRGFDGLVEAKISTAQVPEGISVWEMGTNEDVKQKVDRDFAARMAVASKDQTFVFVTPHPWDGKRSWVAERRAEGRWKNVVVLESVDLAAWLEDAPAVARWLARQMGIPAEGLRDIELFTAEFDATYGINVSDDLIISGRGKAVEELHQWLRGTNVATRVEGQSIEEASAFIAASVRKLPDDLAEIILPRMVFVDVPEAMDFLASLPSVHFVVPQNIATIKRARALNSPMLRLLVPGSPSPGTPINNSDKIRLSTVRRDACEAALKVMGVSAQRAERIARECKGRFSAVLWMIARERNTPLAWTSGAPVVELLPLVLVGQWEVDSTSDRQIIEQICGRPYTDIEKTLATWQAPAGPLVRRGGLWDWLAWDFAWAALAPHIEMALVNRFCDVVKSVLETPDPSLELEPNQRFAAAIYGKTHPFSSAIRTGLVGSIIQLALSREPVAGTSGQMIADRVVAGLLNGSQMNQKQAWLSLANWLPDLAEAAPDVFLNSLRSFRSTGTEFAVMFDGAEFFGPNPHVHVLWALDRLAWSKEHFASALCELLELSAIDPGGKLLNRPPHSIVQILRPWHPQTAVGVQARLAALDILYARQPEITWNVAVALLPTDHDVAGPATEPKWREWKSVDPEHTTIADYWIFEEGLVRRMIQWAKEKPDRWKQLIEHYLSVLKGHPELAQELLNAMQELGSNGLPEAVRVTLCESLRQIVTWHKTMAARKLNNDIELVAPLKELCQRLEPTNPRFRYQWLFVGWPRLPQEMDESHEDHNRRVHQARIQAIKEVFEAESLDGLFEFCETVERPDIVGYVATEIELQPATEATILTRALSVEVDRKNLASSFLLGIGYISRASQCRGDGWADHAMQLPGMKWDSLMLANLAWGLPKKGITWDRVDGWGAEVSSLYWGRTPFEYILDPVADGERAVRKLLDAGRPYSALNLAEDAFSLKTLQGDKTDVDRRRNLIRTLLLEAPKHDPDKEWFAFGFSMLGHRIEHLIEILETLGEEQDVLASIEWAWMPALEHGQRGLKALEKSIADSPETFIQIIKLVFRSDKEVEIASSGDKRFDAVRAKQATSLLLKWDLVPGAELLPVQSITKIEGDVHFQPGRVDMTVLRKWVSEARELATASGHLEVCDVRIGEVLAHAPCDPDGTWPCVGVRDFIESIANAVIERGLRIGVYNKRGAHCRAPGGQQERELAAKFRSLAERVRVNWPRTGAILLLLAKEYETEGLHHDSRAEFDEFE